MEILASHILNQFFLQYIYSATGFGFQIKMFLTKTFKLDKSSARRIFFLGLVTLVFHFDTAPCSTPSLRSTARRCRYSHPRCSTCNPSSLCQLQCPGHSRWKHHACRDWSRHQSRHGEDLKEEGFIKRFLKLFVSGTTEFTIITVLEKSLRLSVCVHH
jgi:hypothetical protein